MNVLNARERFLKCMRFEPVEPPSFELGAWGQTIDRWLKEGMPYEPPDFFYGWQEYGIDRRGYLPIDLSPIPPFRDEVIEEDERYVVYRDGAGVLHRALKPGTARGTRMSMDQYLDFPVKDEESFEEIRKRLDPEDPHRYPSNWPDVVHFLREHVDVPICPFSNGTLGFYWLARQWMGTVGISKAFYVQPMLVHKIMEFIADFMIAVSHRALHDLEGRIDYLNISEDFAYNRGPHISPKIYIEFILPNLKRVTDFMRSHGVKVIWLDSDGNFEPLLPLLIEGGVNCIWPLEIAAGMDPLKIRHEYGKAMALCGGLDKREIAKDESAIERELGKIPELISEGGYFPTLDHTFPPDISYGNFMYYLKMKRAMVRKGLCAS